MNDLDEIRRLLPETEAPEPLVVAQARARMFTEVPTARPRLGLRFAVVAGLGAAVAAGVVVLPGQDAPTTSISASSSGRDVLLVAAIQAGKAPAATGRYFRTRVLGVADHRVGTAPNTYQVRQRFLAETWVPANAELASLTGAVVLGAVPASPADAEAWKRDGSPAEWKITGPGGFPVELSGKPGEPSLADAALERKLGYGVSADGKPLHLTKQEIASLPSDENALRTFLLNRPVDPRIGNRTWLIRSATLLLSEFPTTPEVRAGLFRMLAGMDGVRSDGPATDPQGRPGTALTITPDAGQSGVLKLIVDPDSGLLLSYLIEEAAQPGADVAAVGHQVVLSAEWTDAEPSPPPTELR